MDNEKGPLSWLKKKLSGKDGPPEKKSGKYQYLMIVVLFGAAIMLIGNILGDENPDMSVTATKEAGTEEDAAVFGQKKSAGNDVILSMKRLMKLSLPKCSKV